MPKPNRKSGKNNKNTSRITRRKRFPKQKGGSLVDPISWDSMHTPSTSGSFSNFFGNIIGLVESSVNATLDTVNLIEQAMSVPSDLHKAYAGPSDPNPYNVSNI